MLPTQRKSTSILKHPDAIHVAAKKNGKFNLLHRKMLNTLSYLAKEDIEHFTNYQNIDDFIEEHEGKEVNHEANVTDFKTILKFNSNETNYLRTVLTELMGTVLEFDVLKPEDKRTFKAMPLLTNAEIEDGVVRWSYRSEIRRMLLSPKQYQMLDLEITNSFKQDAALALYENVIRFERLGFSPWFAKDDLRLLIGASSPSYEQYKIFNNRVLKPALKQIKEVSKVEFKPIVKKHGKRIAYIKFQIIRSQEQDLFRDNDASDIPDDQLRLSLQDIGFKDKQIMELYDAYDLSYLEEKVIWIQKKLCTDDSIKNPAGFAYAAIKHDYETSCVDKTRKVNDVLTTNESGISAVNGVGCPMFSGQILLTYMSEEEIAYYESTFRHTKSTIQHGMSNAMFNDALSRPLTNDDNPLKDKFITFLKGQVFMNGEISLKVKQRMEEAKSEVTA